MYQVKKIIHMCALLTIAGMNIFASFAMGHAVQTDSRKLIAERHIIHTFRHDDSWTYYDLANFRYRIQAKLDTINADCFHMITGERCFSQIMQCQAHVQSQTNSGRWNKNIVIASLHPHFQKKWIKITLSVYQR